MKISKYIVRNKISFTLLTLLFAGNLSAQSPDMTVIDKIIAKVDNYIVLKSELERSYLQVQSSGDYNTTKCNVLEGLVLKSVDFKDSRVSQAQFHEYITYLAEKHGISSDKYSNLIRFTRYITIYESIDLFRMFREMEDVEKEMRRE